MAKPRQELLKIFSWIAVRNKNRASQDSDSESELESGSEPEPDPEPESGPKPGQRSEYGRTILTHSDLKSWPDKALAKLPMNIRLAVLFGDWKVLSESNRVGYGLFRHLSRRYAIGSGKWTIHAQRHEADQVWGQICRAYVAGKFPSCSSGNSYHIFST